MLYGLDVTHVDEKCMLSLENSHRNFAKYVQNLPQNTPNPAPLATVGWISISAYVAYIKIMFLVRTLCLPVSSIYRKVLVYRFKLIMEDTRLRKNTIISPVESMIYCVNRYGLTDTIASLITGGNQSKVNPTKGYVKRLILEFETAQWKASCMLYPQLDNYLKVVTSIKMYVWWEFVQRQPHLTKYVSAVLALLSGSQPVGMQQNFGKRFCSLCSKRARDTPAHILFDCEALNDLRKKWLTKVYRSMPAGMVTSMINANDVDKCQLFLSALKCEHFVDEWTDIFSNISTFVHQMYHERSHIYERLINANAEPL